MSTSRRQFLIRSAGLAAATTLPGSLLLAAPALASDETDALSSLVGLEQASALMYTTISENKALGSTNKDLIDKFHAQEEAHVTAFAKALDQLGEDAPDTPTDVADIKELKGLDHAKTEMALLGFAIALEERLVGSYVGATADFDGADIIRSGSQVGANHMQHLVALRLTRGDDPAAAIKLPATVPADQLAADSGTTSTDDSSTGESSTPSESTSSTDSSNSS